MSNWVERRKARKLALAAKAGSVWNEIRAAIQDACQSYNAWIGTSVNTTVVCALENGKRVRISKDVRQVLSPTSWRDENITVVVEFSAGDSPSISVAGDGPVQSVNFKIDSDEERAFIKIGGEVVSPDQISERILNPLLFPTGKYVDTRNI